EADRIAVAGDQVAQLGVAVPGHQAPYETRNEAPSAAAADESRRRTERIISSAPCSVPDIKKQKYACHNARHCDRKADSNVQGLPPQQFRQDRAAQFQLLKLVLGLDDIGEIGGFGGARNDEMFGAALGIARD